VRPLGQRGNGVRTLRRAYRAQCLALERRIRLDGWMTLVMKRPAAGGAKNRCLLRCG
jgi:hypothetical protein